MFPCIYCSFVSKKSFDVKRHMKGVHTIDELMMKNKRIEELEREVKSLKAQVRVLEQR